MFLKKLGLASRTCALQNSLPVLARSLLHNSRNRQIKKAHANMVAGTLGSDVWREEEGAAAGLFKCHGTGACAQQSLQIGHLSISNMFPSKIQPPRRHLFLLL
eukprot:1160843-Pelagomonas_calceolata.AAC.6